MGEKRGINDGKLCPRGDDRQRIGVICDGNGMELCSARGVHIDG